MKGGVSMSIFMVPAKFPSINAAVSIAEPGDTVLVQCGIYPETVTIPSDKNAIRVIADVETGNVILDGGGRLDMAYNIMANHVEIKGFTIINYVNAGIRVSGPTGLLFLIGSKLIGNTITNIIQGDGITLVDAFATLIWRNRIQGAARNAVSVTGTTMNTWTLDNELSGGGGNGVLNQSSANVGGTIARNRILANSGDGILDNAGANLIFGNRIDGNAQNGIEEASPAQTAGFGGIVSNQITRNRRDGVRLEQDRTVVAGNRLQNNLGAGIRIDTSFNVVQSNIVHAGKGNGVMISPEAQENLIIRNAFTRNVPFDISLNNPQNNLVENHWFTCTPANLCTQALSTGETTDGRGL
jgi:hypothetical protein